MRFARAVVAAMVLTAALAAPALGGFAPADVSVSKADSPDPVVAGTNLTYTITVQNAGPAPAPDVTLSDPLPAGTTFVSFTTPAGWTATTPAVGGTGTVSANAIGLLAGPFVSTFTLVVNVGSATPNGTVLTNVASVTVFPSADPNLTNNSSATQTTVTAPAASLADAAMPEPAATSPLVTLGFMALLLAMLSGAAVLAVRRVRP